MTYLTDTRPGAGFDAAALDRTDRLLLGGTVVVWLAALGAGVAATVALVDLGSGQMESTGDSGTPWILYTIIGVSAAVIVAAVPLLLRARRTSDDEMTPVEKRLAQQAAERAQTPPRAGDAPTEKLRVPPPPPNTNSGRLPRILQSPAIAASVANSPAVDRLWLRNTAALVCAMGAATLFVSVATYLMAIDNDTISWVLYGVAGVVTVGMAAIPWYFLRELRAELGA
ncbi:DUF2561 family protein [Mycolicibacterium iranicum]|uniref:DUF2561 domain-containing protein n=1 Tax=Mycolicibacterium iranicum TaxID=912594 RepID=A0A178LB92_MYCIR|nr:DUF2561 family protein [Mycolicibacterium iranicum]OAN27375.1 hypothetical protein A4X20_10965 [Mycolicibacterium iranicum]